MNKLLVILVALVALLSLVQNAPVGRQRGKNKNMFKKAGKAAKFLLKFGYLDILKEQDSAGANDPASPAFKNAVKRLQRFGNIPVTGRIDSKTLELISKSRCGVKDPSLPSSRRRRSVGEFNLQGTKWEKLDLTYKIINYTNDGITRDEQQQIFRSALNLWQSASRLRFTEVNSDEADILVSFVTKTHGDGYPFDGEGGTLAHAFYPHNNEGLSGDAHFDDDERFTTRTRDGINLDWVAVHEFGHSLGLEHSSVLESIMYPWYRGYVPDIKLNDDDVKGIQELYGELSTITTETPTTTEPPTTAEPPTTTELLTTTETQTTTDPPTTTESASSTEPPITTGQPSTTELPTTDLTTVLPATTTIAPNTTDIPSTKVNPSGHPACSPGTRYDAVFVDDFTYFFKGDQFWTVNNVLQKSEPKQVRDYWPDVPTPVDAAYCNKAGHVMFFKSKTFWEYNGRRLLKSGSVRDRYGFRRFGKVNAVVTFQGDHMTYFLKGTKYWRYNEATGKAASRDPRRIRGAWRAVKNLDAATTWINKKVYVFKGVYYYKLKSIKNGNISVDRRYPQRIARRWMRCPKQGKDREMSIGSLESEP